MQEELVSVIIPAYNAERTLDATLESVMQQTYRQLEILVVNDGSTDGTEEVARRHAAEDDRIRVLSIPNGGVANARNKGIAASTGAFVATIDADDLWHPEKIALQMQALKDGGEEFGYAYCLSRRIDDSGCTLGVLKSYPMQGRIFLQSIVFNSVGNGSCILARRSALEEAGGFEPDPEIQEDNLVQIMMNRSWRVKAVPLYLTGYRQVGESRSSDYERAARGRFAVLDLVAERFPETPDAVLSLAESRIRAIMAAQAFRQRRVVRGMIELARACRRAPVYALEFAAIDLATRLLGGIRSALRGRTGPAERRGKDFFACDPADPVILPPRPIEKRKLRALSEMEESFFQAVPSSSVTPKAMAMF